MASDELWRFAEPDGKQRSVSLEELRISFSKGVLATNTPVWRKGFADWKTASLVPELKASVLAGARVVPSKGTAIPGKPLSPASGDSEGPGAPPAYQPNAKGTVGRPQAPAISSLPDTTSGPAAKDLMSEAAPDSQEDTASFERPTRNTIPLGNTEGSYGSGVPTPRATSVSGESPPLPPMRSKSSTLVTYSGAPPADATPNSAVAPIVVPSPAGEKPARSITQPPPVDLGAVATQSSILDEPPPSSASEVTSEMFVEDSSKVPPAADSTQQFSADSTRRMAALSESIPEPVSTSMIMDPDESSAKLPPTTDISGAYDAVTTSMLLPDVGSDPGSIPPTSSEEIGVDELMPASSRTVDQVLRSSYRPKMPSIPPPLPRSEPRLPVDDVPYRLGLASRPPPPDISPISAGGRSLETFRPPADTAATLAERRGVPWPTLIVGLAVTAGGAFYVGRTSTPPPSTVIRVPVSAQTTATIAPVATAKAAEEKVSVQCKLSGAMRTIAPSAVPSVGVEVTAKQDALAIGYAVGAKQAFGVKLNAKTLEPEDQVDVPADVEIRRVVPVLAERVGVVIEHDLPDQGVSKRRRVFGTTQFVGLNGRSLVWMKSPSDTPMTVATMTDVDPEAFRAVPNGPAAIAYAFRAGKSVVVGTTEAGDAYSRIAGLGQVGSPSLATVKGGVLVAWADRKNEADTWSVRIAKHSPGKPSGVPMVFKPSGGPGKGFFAPSLFRVAQESVMIVWTERGVKGEDETFQLRGQLLDAAGAPVGDAFQVSPTTLNAGQGQIAVGPDGRGIVAFLVLKEAGVEIAGVPLQCE